MSLLTGTPTAVLIIARLSGTASVRAVGKSSSQPNLLDVRALLAKNHVGIGEGLCWLSEGRAGWGSGLQVGHSRKIVKLGAGSSCEGVRIT